MAEKTLGKFGTNVPYLAVRTGSWIFMMVALESIIKKSSNEYARKPFLAPWTETIFSPCK